MKWEYLLFDFLIFSSSMVLPRLLGVKVREGWRIWLSITIVAIPFLVWDQLVTGSWWFFNSSYVLGLYVGNLPLEEVLFFFFVPRACMVIWELFRVVPERKLFGKSLVLSALFFVTTLAMLIDVFYLSLVSSLLFLLILFFDLWNVRVVIYMFIVGILTAIFNGYLTSRPVVIYNSSEIVGLKIGTIPIEDFLYGFVLVLLVLVIYKKIAFVLQKKV